MKITIYIYSSIVSTVLFLQICGACRNGFVRFQDSCYHLSHDTENWVDAMTVCKVFGGYLAEIASSTENDFLKTLLEQTHSVTEAWVGGNDLAVEGYWEWFNSVEKITYTSWGPGEPNNRISPGENCLIFVNSGLWNDLQCKIGMNYLCEVPSCTEKI